MRSDGFCWRIGRRLPIVRYREGVHQARPNRAARADLAPWLAGRHDRRAANFHLIARCFPQAERHLLTNVEGRGGIAPAVEILGAAGLIQGTIEYPERTRNPGALAALAQKVRSWQPEVAVYLVETRAPYQNLRDWAFLRLLGVRRVIGTTLDGSLSGHLVAGPEQQRESEAARLVRSLRGLGEIDIQTDDAWDLRLSCRERAAAAAALSPIAGLSGFLAFSIGTKAPANDYGDANWSAVIEALCAAAPGLALVGLGAQGEAERTRALMQHWSGPTLDLCGALHVRESAAVLEHALCFLGHDSGPMHLASAVGTPCVAVFSGRNPPGIWFPRGQEETGSSTRRLPARPAGSPSA